MMFPFGVQIVAYLFLAGLAAGMALFGSFAPDDAADGTAVGTSVNGGGNGYERETPGGRQAIGWAAAFSLAGAAFLVGDLERPATFSLILFEANPTSAIAWGARILVVFCLAAVAASLPRGRWSGLDLATLWILRLSAVGLCVYPAFVLRQAHAYPLWQSPVLVPLITVSSLHAGACAVAMLGPSPTLFAHTQTAERVLGALQLVLALLFMFDAIAAAGAGTAVVTQSPAIFWGAFFAAGTAIPLFAVAFRPGLAQPLRCALVVFGSLALRYWLVAAGQAPHAL